MGCLRRLKLHQSRMLQDFWSQELHEGWLHSFLSVQRSSGLVGTCDPQIECASTRTSTGTSTQTSTRSSTPKRHRWHLFGGVWPVWRQELEWTHMLPIRVPMPA